MGEEEWLKSRGVNIRYANEEERGECEGLMRRFAEEKPELCERKRIEIYFKYQTFVR